MTRFLLYAAAFFLAGVAAFLATAAWCAITRLPEEAPLYSRLMLLAGLALGLWVGACVYDRLVTAWTAPKTERPWR